VEIFAQVGLIRDEEERKKSLERLRKVAKEPEWYDHYLVAELDGKVVGRVILEVAYPPYSELINLYVHSDYRGKGVGSSLVQKCIEIASDRKCFVMSVMADPMGNLPAHRLYSKFGFRPGILGDSSLKRGHMWLFRFSEESCVSEFLKRHPFAETSVSPSKVDFHDRMLYRMAWKDPQTEEKMALYIEGQPSQTPDGTMPRISGFSYQEEDTELQALIQEQSKTVTQGVATKFAISSWNLRSKPLEIALYVSIPDGTTLTPATQCPSSIRIDPRNEKTLQFEFIWPSRCKLPDFTTFSTLLVTGFFTVEGLQYQLLASAGFDKTQLP